MLFPEMSDWGLLTNREEIGETLVWKNSFHPHPLTPCSNSPFAWQQVQLLTAASNQQLVAVTFLLAFNAASLSPLSVRLLELGGVEKGVRGNKQVWEGGVRGRV
ncbi:hypothetical protein CDAR_27851 [Caerostris darwini]|uniref:Uncharacterized protein n=1 Tax=Caerostris darwini TaxID=1538125 RepID=A0AAV4SR41_9ARAC|nr:hypothetical protein CDAR_27851 [Caerostris darwini]